MGSQNLLWSVERRLLCECGNGICKYLPLKNDPSRYFYKCLAPHCSKGNNDFFKWADKVSDDDYKFVSVPNCRCTAGLCRVRMEKDGVNAGRILFSCTIKQGQGSCGYRVYEDELVMMHQVDDPGLTLPTFPPQVVDLVMENGLTERATDSYLPQLTSENIGSCSGSKKMKGSLWCQEEKLGESSSLPCKRLRNGDSEGVCPPLHSMQAECLVKPVNSSPKQKSPLRPVNILSPESSELSRNHPGAGTSILSPCNKNRPLQWQEDKLGESSLSNKGYSPLSDSRAMVQAESVLNSTHCISPGSVISSMSFNMNVEVSGIKTSCHPSNVLSHEEPYGVLSPNNYTSQSVSTTHGQFAVNLQIQNLLSYLETRDPKDHEAMKQKAESTFKVLDGMFFESGPLKHQVDELIKSARSLQSTNAELSGAEALLKDKEKKYADAAQELEDTLDLHGAIKVEHNKAKAAFDCKRSQLRRIFPQSEQAESLVNSSDSISFEIWTPHAVGSSSPSLNMNMEVSGFET